MDEDETNIPDPRHQQQQPPPNVNVNVGNGRGLAADLPSLGLRGLWGTVGNFSATVVLVGLFCAVLIWDRHDRGMDRTDRIADRVADRAERVEERALFREAIRDMNTEQNRRTGEVKGAVDVNTAVMRDLIQEFRSARATGTIKPDSPLPKASPP